MLISLGEIIYDNEKQVSTKRVARIITYIADLFVSTKSLQNGSKFMPGMLYAIGGLLKVEARNYLETKKILDTSFETAGPVRENSSEAEKILERSKRELS